MGSFAGGVQTNQCSRMHTVDAEEVQKRRGMGHESKNLIGGGHLNCWGGKAVQLLRGKFASRSRGSGNCRGRFNKRLWKGAYQQKK